MHLAHGAALWLTWNGLYSQNTVVFENVVFLKRSVRIGLFGRRVYENVGVFQNRTRYFFIECFEHVRLAMLFAGPHGHCRVAQRT